MLAAQFLDGGEPAFDFFLARRIDVERFEVTRQLARRFANLDGGFVHHRNDLGEPLIDARQRLDSGERARRGGVRIAVVGVVQQADRRLRGFGEPAAIGMARAFFGELRHFAFLEVERLELAHLEPEQLESRIAIARLAFELDGAIDERDPDLVRLAHRVGELEVVAEVVEQLALRGGARQRLEFVLPVDIDDERADIAQQLQRHRNAIEVAARTAIVGDDAAHGELVFRLDGLLREHFAQRRRALADVEGGRELGAFGARAHHFGTALAAGEQRERVDHDGFAGAGFAREHREAGAHFEIDEIDDGEVTNLQMGQHGSLGFVETAASPMELGAQQAVILELVRVQQRDLLRSRMHFEAIAGRRARRARRRRR